MAASLESKRKIEAALRATFGQMATLHVLDGYRDSIEVWVTSPRFADVPEYMRQNQVWEVLESALPDDELVKVTILLTFTPDEPEYQWALRERDIPAAAK